MESESILQQYTVSLTDISADFTGRRAIQDAIDSINDASPDNRYEIQVDKGVYVATEVAHFDKNAGGNCFILMKDYVDVIGFSKEDVIIYGSLPDNLGVSFPYSSYQPVYFNDNASLKRVSVFAKNKLMTKNILFFSKNVASLLEPCLVRQKTKT